MWKVSVFITLCCLFIGTAHTASIDCNIDECRKPMKIYEELGCKPIYGSKSCCPKRFECPDDMKVVKDENKCTFEGIDYKIGEVLPRNLTTESKCVEACICSRYEEEPAKFLCTNSDCGISSFKVPGCINIYGDLNECCSTSIVCDDEEKEKLATCWDEDVEYHEGEKFISKSNPCYECLCHKDFDNTTIIEKNSHCHKLNCEIELKYKSFIQRGCLPIFENDKCCPVDWKCFDSVKKSKKVVKRSPDEDEDSIEEEDSSENSKEDSDDDDSKETEEPKIPSTAEPVKVSSLEISQFLPPFEDKTEPTLVKEDDKETTTQSLTTEKALQDEEQAKEIETTQKPSDETTLSSNSDEITTLSVTEASSVSESVTEAVSESTTSKIETTESVTESESTTLSTESTTVITEKAKKDESSEESSDEDDDENIFGGDINNSDEVDDKNDAGSSSVDADDTDVTTQVTLSSTETATESSTQFLSQPEVISKSATESILEVSTEEQTTVASVEDESEKSLDQSEETTTEVTEIPTTSLPETEELKISTESVKITEEAKTTEPTVAKDQELTPPVPTQIDMILTTLKELKEYVSKLSMLQTTRTSESEPPASFVNFTVSRSLPITPITENNEDNFDEGRLDVRSIRKRSVEQKSVYIKFSNKEKGCTVGTQLYRVGDEIKTDDKCLACFCNYSPIGHCIKNEKCKST